MTAIVDLVISPPPPSRRGPAIAVAVLVHAALLSAALAAQPSLEAWSADLAARIHDDLTRVEVVDIETPPPPPPPEADEPPPPPPPPADKPADAPPPAPAPHAPRVRIKVHNPPAQAGKVIATHGALDMTGDVIVQGFASGYAGGVTSGTGTGTAPGGAGSTAPTQPPKPQPPPPAPTRDLSAPVSLPFDEWSCPWPAEAMDLAIDEQTAIIKVTVGADGQIEASRVVSDPGDGFGKAALECARGARLIPARDRYGRPIRATATARLRFYR